MRNRHPLHECKRSIRGIDMALGQLIESITQPGAKELEELGLEIGKLYTDKGFPIDMALDRLPHTKEQKVSILFGACQWFIEHKRNSGAGEKSIERQRNVNRKMIEDFVATGETGVY